MNRTIILLFIISITASCGESKQDKLNIEGNYQSEVIEIDSVDNDQKQTNESKIIERYFPEELTFSRFDTLLTNSNLKVSITSRYIDSYVTNEFESDGTKYIDKYRNTEHQLIITRASSTLIDTVLSKQNTIEFTDQEFLDIATFHGFWFKEFNESYLNFFGTITKPETDWTLPFYYHFDISTKKLTFEPYIEEEI